MKFAALFVIAVSLALPASSQSAEAPKKPSTVAEYKVALAERDLTIAKQNKSAYIAALMPSIEALPQVAALTKAVESAQSALDAAKAEASKEEAKKPATKK